MGNSTAAAAYGAVDEYLEKHLVGSDPVLDAALENSRAAGLPPINVPPAQGKLLYLLARLQQAKRVLEIGTLAGYSTIWLARALPPQGRIVTLEFEHERAGALADRRVELTDPKRGGVLTHASVLTITSNPTRTSPVKRGKWIMEQILGTPPPPPPPEVPELEEQS